MNDIVISKVILAIQDREKESTPRIFGQSESLSTPLEPHPNPGAYLQTTQIVSALINSKFSLFLIYLTPVSSPDSPTLMATVCEFYPFSVNVSPLLAGRHVFATTIPVFPKPILSTHTKALSLSMQMSLAQMDTRLK